MARETFEDFMTRCLHDPKRGYYSRNIRNIGARGDFTTAPQLSEAPAKAIAAWAARAMRKHKTSHLIEIGPGSGILSRQVLCHLPFLTRHRTKLHLVESSAPLAAHQKEALRGRNVGFHDDIRAALKTCSGNAVIFSNELVDAFPVRLFQKSGGAWLEIALDRSQGHVRETLLDPGELPGSSVFELDFPDGQRVEVHESYRQWLETWLPLWRRGEMLTIDYGDTANDLYRRRPMGSVRAYLLHQRIEGPGIYQNEGLQDLTADVNFTDLQEWTQPWLCRGEIEDLAGFIRPFVHKEDVALLEACGNFMALSQSRKDPP